MDVFCDNYGVNLFEVSASNQATGKKGKRTRKLMRIDRTKCTVKASTHGCQNNARNTLLIEARTSSDVNSISEQTIDAEKIVNKEHNVQQIWKTPLFIVGQDHHVNSNIKQTGKANNNCEGEGVTCSATATNTINNARGSRIPVSATQSTTASNAVEETETGDYNVEQNAAKKMNYW